MTPLDTKLFNEYKRLDKLLRDSRGTERGVTDYIDEMKAVSRYESCSIPGWEQDRNRLWRCRHIRNQLAHDDVPDYTCLSREEDVAFLREFYNRVLKGEDPLARLQRLQQSEQSSQPTGCLTCLLLAAITLPVTLCMTALQRFLSQ